jgi:acyl-CoA thioester hydrolase
MLTAPIFHHPYQVYINHTDAGGIVYHANHLIFYEHSRRDWFAKLGLNAYFFNTSASVMNQATHADNGADTATHNDIHHFVVADAHLKYQQPILLDETIAVTIDKVTLRAASLIFEQSIYRLSKEQENLTNNLDEPTNVMPAFVQKSQLLSQARIVIACVHNELVLNSESASTAAEGSPVASRPELKIRPARLPQALRAAIEQVLAY